MKLIKNILKVSSLSSIVLVFGLMGCGHGMHHGAHHDKASCGCGEKASCSEHKDASSCPMHKESATCNMHDKDEAATKAPVKK